jgi:hypothetical protein
MQVREVAYISRTPEITARRIAEVNPIYILKVFNKMMNR